MFSPVGAYPCAEVRMMIGHIVPGPGRALGLRLSIERALGLPLLRVETPGPEIKPRHTRRAARILRKKGVRRVLVPAEFPHWDILERHGLQGVETGEFCRALAAPIALAALKRDGVRPQMATVVLRGERVTRAMRTAALALCSRVKHLVISAPTGGEALRAELRQEFGIPALEDGPARRSDLGIHFSPAAGRGERTIDLAGPEPSVEGFSFSVERGEFPADCQTVPLLSALWESGRLDPAEIAVTAHFHT